MDLEKYREILDWFKENFKTTDFLRDRISQNMRRVFESFPDDYYTEFSQNPNFLTVNESELTGPERGIRRNTIVNPFFYMMLVIACQTTYDLVMEKMKKELKTCSNCGTDNNKTAKFCSECGTPF